MCEAAARKNAKQPNYQGLQHYLSHSFDESGSVIATDLQRYIAEEQKAEAVVMKQHRLWTEEVGADAKKKGEKTKGAGKGTEESQ